MNLIIDIGNSRTKAAILCGGEIVEQWCQENLGADELATILTKYPVIHGSILSSTRNETSDVERFLSEHVRNFIRFGATTPTPIKNLYETPETLGADRIAAAVGAYSLFPGKTVLVVDMGTAITIDMVTSEGEFLGGNISPGAQTRLRALNHFTGKLPLLDAEHAFIDTKPGLPAMGRNTQEAIRAGVFNGIVYELDGYIDSLKGKIEDLHVIFTGGEAKYFVEKLKNTIFANYDLVVIGLNTILEYNAEQK